MSIRFFTHTKSGEIISRLNNDVVGAQSAITGTIPNVVTNVITLVSTLAVMLAFEWRLTLLSIVVLPLFLLPAKRVARMLRDIRRQAMDLNSEMSSHIGETLSINGAMLVKIFGRQRQELARYGESSAGVRDLGVRRAIVGRWFFMGLGLSAALGTALVYWVGGRFVLDGELTVGTIVAFLSYIFRLYGPFSALTNVQVEFAQAMVSFERVFAIDVLAGVEGRQADGRVPMVGCADRHGLDILAIEQLAIVLVDVGLATGLLLGPFGMLALHVAHGHHVAELHGAAHDARPLAADADRAD
jgi:ATP-binding cassette subfamily B protein